MKVVPWFSLVLSISLLPTYSWARLDKQEQLDFNAMAEQAEPLITKELDIEQLFHLGNDALNNGKIDDAIDYFVRATQGEKSSPQVFFNLGVSYEKKGDIDNAIEAYKDAILLKLDYTKAHQQLATLLQRKGNIDEAITHYQHTANLNHNLVDAAVTAARLLCQQERYPEALPFFARTLEKRPQDIQLKFEYANTLTTCNKNEQAITLFQELLRDRPNDVAILYNTAFTLKKLGRVTEAMPYYQAALSHKPDHAEAHFSLGLAYLTIGDFKRGWPEYEWRWQRNSQLSPRKFTQPQWDGTPLNGKTVLIHAEQGLGDTFQFIRYVQEVKQRETGFIICAVQNPVHTIIARCCPYIDQVVTLSTIPASFDVHIPLISLPLLLNTELHTIPNKIPYIFPDQTLVNEWNERLAHDESIKVGICYQGNNQYSTAFLRAAVAAKSLPVHTFAPLSQLEGVTLYCLQKETGTDQLKQLPSRFDIHLFDDKTFDTTNGRFMDTAAVIQNLDLVITVDTSIAHLSAAIGKPTWILLPKPADWRWMLTRSDTPWYPNNVRLFRQPKTGDWKSVIETIKEELKSFITDKQQEQEQRTVTPFANPHNGQDIFNELLKIRLKAIKDLETDDTDAFLLELRRAYKLYKVHKLIQKISQDAA